MKKSISYDAVSLLLTSLMIINLLAILPINISHAQGNTMNFTTGETIDFHSTTTMSFWSGISFMFGSGIYVQFIEVFNGNGVIEPCDVIHIMWPPGFIMEPCSWWEVLDPLGNPTGFEFHIDQMYGPDEFHVDQVWPQPFPLPLPGGVNLAEKKISRIQPCDYFVVHWPAGWYPRPCTWWEIMDPETHEPTGFEFHVDWTNESCEFHIDEMIPGPYVLAFPWHMLEARQKIETINACDWFYILDLPGFDQPCTWWEVLDPITGDPTGLEFHVDIAPGDGTFHVDETNPLGGISIPISYPTRARQKITTIEPCSWFEVDDPATVPKTCTWWKIIRPDIGDVEFHVDQYDPNTGQFHVDQVLPAPMQIPPIYQLAAEKKFVGISPCDWLRVEYPNGFLPTVCSWWRITWPPEWAGVEFHVDSTNGLDKFHIDTIDPLPQGPTPPPWNVTAEEFTPEDPWYWKPNYDDYATSGVPDFDQRQGGTYVWQDPWQQWSHCGPVAVANSLWWLDSEFEPHPIPPPVVNDGYPLVQSYGQGQWDDHDPQNVPWLVEHLAYLMDTDGRRTGLVHSGTDVHDMEAGLSHYLSWAGVNPQGDVNGDGEVNTTDVDIVSFAMGSVPGMPLWNLAADVFPASLTYPPFADNVIDPQDLTLVLSNLGQKGVFYEHTVMMPEFNFIEEELKKCQDVVLLVGYWIFDGSNWYREPGGHYVTVAGVDSTNQKLALSDPVQDAFENGLIPEGRIPIPHVHMPPEPPFTTHNNAAFVSQDIYTASLITPPWPPCPGGNWMLVNFASWRPAPPYFAVIESAVVTSPLGVHDIAVTEVTTSKDGCTPLPTVCQNYTVEMKVKVKNNGGYVESFFDVYCRVSDLLGTYDVGMQTISLNPDESTTLTFIWDTHGFAKGSYTVWAYAEPVEGETNTADNTYTDGIITVTMQGDINADNIVDIFDIVRIALAFGAVPTDPNWDPNADINDDGTIDIFDIVIIALHFGETIP